MAHGLSAVKQTFFVDCNGRRPLFLSEVEIFRSLAEAPAAWSPAPSTAGFRPFCWEGLVESGGVYQRAIR